MSEASGTARRSNAVATTVGAFVVAYFVGAVLASRSAYHARVWTEDAMFRALGGFPAAQLFVHHAFQSAIRAFSGTYGTLLFFASLAVPLGFAARIVARARVRAGHRDPLDGIRARVSARPGLTRAALALPAVGWGALLVHFLTQSGNPSLFAYLPPALLAGYAFFASERAALRMLVAPTFDEAPRLEISPDEIVFDAVAVTRETQAAVAVVAVVSLAMTVWIASVPLAKLFTDARILGSVGAYVAVALASAALFRRASRVAVGIDGIRVYGTSRTRFFPYTEIDAARAAGSDLMLMHRDRVALRLQLHGADAARRQAVLDRIDEAITRAKVERHDAAAHFVASATRAELARAVQGGGDYRTTSLSRDQLWAVVEGPAIASAARTAAAEALARTNDPSERARLRVAADHCAEPHVRIAITQLADGGDTGDEEVTHAVRERAAAARA